MSDPVSHLKQELLAAAERQQRHTALTPSSSRRWRERFRADPGRRRRLVVVLAAVVFAAVVTTAGWAIVHSVVTDDSFENLPPVGATPSAPKNGELVIQYRLDASRVDRLKHPGGLWRWVYADGRLITASGAPQAVSPGSVDRWSSGLLEQRLTPEGVELLRSEIVSTGLFEDNQTRPSRGSGSSPDYSTHNEIQVRIGDRLIRVQGKVTADSNEFPKRLRERLADPASWLPGSAWANRRIRAYVPSSYEIWYGAGPQALERSRILSLLPATAADTLRAKDAVATPGDIGTPGVRPHRITRYHSVLTTKEARAVTQALDDAGLGDSFEIPGTSVDPPAGSPEKGPVRNMVGIMLLPYLPHGETVCLACG